MFKALPEPTNIAFALSALAGLRSGEVRALKWVNVDLERRRIYVRESTNGPTKDKDSHEAPFVPGLHDLLIAWEAKSPNPLGGLVCPPTLGMLGKAAPGAGRRYLSEQTAAPSRSCARSSAIRRYRSPSATRT